MWTEHQQRAQPSHKGSSHFRVQAQQGEAGGEQTSGTTRAVGIDFDWSKGLGTGCPHLKWRVSPQWLTLTLCF